MLPTLQILQQAQTSSVLKKGLTEKLEHFLPYEEKIRGQFGLEFVTQMEDAWAEVHLAELDDVYASGFLAAWRLWSEVSSATAEHP